VTGIRGRYNSSHEFVIVTVAPPIKFAADASSAVVETLFTCRIWLTNI
jgi:hypothetical protein